MLAVVAGTAKGVLILEVNSAETYSHECVVVVVIGVRRRASPWQSSLVLMRWWYGME